MVDLETRWCWLDPANLNSMLPPCAVIFLPTAREVNVFTHVCDSVYNWPHGYSLTAHPCWLLGHSLLRYGTVGTHTTGMLSSC